MKNVAKQISRFTRSQIDLLFKHGKAVYKSKELVILTAPCLFACSPSSSDKSSEFVQTTTDTSVDKQTSPIDSSSKAQNNSSRILLITSRKVGNAPQRNLLRRWGRAIYYEQRLFELPRHCVIIFKAPATKLTFDQFKEILVKSAHKNA